MRFSIEIKPGYLHALVYQRDSAEDMRKFLLAVHAACEEHRTPKILVCVRQSRAMFKPEDYGLDGAARGYAGELATSACQVALVGDTEELHSAHEYIELAARNQNLNVRAFRDEDAARRWMDAAARPGQRYRFTRVVIAGAPDDAGIYSLWDGEELVYYGRADGKKANGGSTIRSRLLEHFFNDGGRRPTHYSWELAADPAAREAELLLEHQRAHGKLPRDNKAA